MTASLSPREENPLLAVSIKQRGHDLVEDVEDSKIVAPLTDILTWVFCDRVSVLNPSQSFARQPLLNDCFQDVQRY